MVLSTYFVFSLILLTFPGKSCFSLESDPNGYIVFCPCMGRFGNQADHFLGALSFARGINRTLILPPWVEYGFGRPGSSQVPFDTYFLVEAFSDYHRVITMEEFMKELAPSLWPPEKRIAFCWGPRMSHSGSTDTSCHAKEGNPFGPFWDYSKIDFVRSEFFGELGYSVHLPHQADAWKNKYPPSEFPVLAFTGAPASFPVKKQDRKLHKYLKWSTYISDKATKFIKRTLPEGPFVGIHLRNDMDWDNVCMHVDENSSRANHLFASPQCLGYNNEFGHVTMDICKPKEEAIVQKVIKAVKKYNAKSVFVAADKDHMLRQLNGALQKIGVRAFRMEPDEPHVSLAILARSTYYIGNCVSSFSAFAARERAVLGLPTGFWGFKAPKNEKSKRKQEDSHVEL